MERVRPVPHHLQLEAQGAKREDAGTKAQAKNRMPVGGNSAEYAHPCPTRNIATKAVADKSTGGASGRASLVRVRLRRRPQQKRLPLTQWQA
jgi:hypothetical protein